MLVQSIKYYYFSRKKTQLKTSKMKAQIQQFIEDLAQEMKDLGVKEMNISINHSSTDFGNSSYLYVGPWKIRHSDHSTGFSRMISEVNVGQLNRRDVLEMVERYYFPERYEEVQELCFKGEIYTTESDMLKRIANGWEVIVLDADMGVSKSGNKKVKIRVKNNLVVTYKKVA